MNRLIRIGVAVALAAASAVAVSQAPPGPGGPPGGGAKATIENRQAIFKLIGSQSGAIGGINRGNATPDLAAIARNAARIQMLADMIPEMFATDTTADTAVKTRAKPEIWKNMADFKSKAEALSKAAGVVADAAKKGDLAATKAAASGVTGACQGCHDGYRGPP